MVKRLSKIVSMPVAFIYAYHRAFPLKGLAVIDGMNKALLPLNQANRTLVSVLL
jgi:hypothetical protein